MLIVDDVLVSDDVIDVCFVCDLDKCHGDCCVEGDVGAPLDEEEVSILEDIVDTVKPYMSSSAVAEVEANGVFDYDAAGSFVTPLVNGVDCVYLCYDGDLAMCAIEKAYNEGLLGDLNWKKPISCHLYPIRVATVGKSDALNYDKWSICKCALKNGNRLEVKIYEFLKEPLIRKYGEEWYAKLESLVKDGKSV